MTDTDKDDQSPPPENEPKEPTRAPIRDQSTNEEQLQRTPLDPRASDD